MNGNEAVDILETDDLEREVRQEVAVYVAPIRSFLVVDDPTMQRAGDTILEINKRIKLVDEKFSPSYEAAMETKRKAEASRKALVDLIDEIKRPLVEVKAYLVKQGKDYKAVVAKREEEERRRLAEIARKEAEERALAEAEALEKAGEHEEAQAVIEAPVYAAPPPIQKPAFKVDGRSFQTRWKATVTDFCKLVKYCAANPQFLHLVMANDSALNQMARALKQNMNIPGVSAQEE